MTKRTIYVLVILSIFGMAYLFSQRNHDKDDNLPEYIQLDSLVIEEIKQSIKTYTGFDSNLISQGLNLGGIKTATINEEQFPIFYMKMGEQVIWDAKLRNIPLSVFYKHANHACKKVDFHIFIEPETYKLIKITAKIEPAEYSISYFESYCDRMKELINDNEMFFELPDQKPIPLVKLLEGKAGRIANALDFEAEYLNYTTNDGFVPDLIWKVSFYGEHYTISGPSIPSDTGLIRPTPSTIRVQWRDYYNGITGEPQGSSAKGLKVISINGIKETNE